VKQEIIYQTTYDTLEILDHMKIIGPLTMDSRKNRVYIVPNVKLKLNQNEFDSLYMLAIRENISLSFEWLYNAVWDIGDGTDRRKEAIKGIEKVVKRINNFGAGFVWISKSSPDNYTFHSRWGHNINEWQTDM